MVIWKWEKEAKLLFFDRQQRMHYCLFRWNLKFEDPWKEWTLQGFLNNKHCILASLNLHVFPCEKNSI
jgi:hypothetical protein